MLVVAFCLKFTDSSGEDIATGGVRGWWRCRAAVENDETKLMLCDVIFILLLLGSELRIVRSGAVISLLKPQLNLEMDLLHLLHLLHLLQSLHQLTGVNHTMSGLSQLDNKNKSEI